MKMYNFAKQLVFPCSELQNECKTELRDLKHIYKHGPELSFVGKKYGVGQSPKILFSRLNPIWQYDIGDFCTKESIELYEKHSSSSDDIFEKMIYGWKYKNQIFRGLKDAGTVLGHVNKKHAKNVSSENFEIFGSSIFQNPNYGVLWIIQKLIEKKVFTEMADCPLDHCSINNIIKCAGHLKNANPTTIMKKKCKYYCFEIDILEPDIIIAMGNDTHNYINNNFKIYQKSNGVSYLRSNFNSLEIQYWNLCHPIGTGILSWLGSQINKKFLNVEDYNNEYNEIEKKKFRQNKFVFAHVMNMIDEIVNFNQNKELI
jgi:hypothetical protein